MLAEAKSLFDQQEWVVFFGWEPHWMNIVMDISYLKSRTEATSEIGASESIVYTITSSALPESHPEVFKLMQQLRVPTKVQSAWIYEYRHQKRKPKEVAAEWIAANVDNGLIVEWLQGIKAKDGREAIEAIRAAYQ
jgi:glycine betaine/proline transport system substrate-binding protein